MSALFYALRWGVYLLRWLAFMAYSIVEFFGKPGSRVIVPLAGGAAAYVWRAPLDAVIQTYALSVDWQRMPEPLTLEIAAAVGVVLAVCVYVVVSPRMWRIRRVMSGVGALVRFVLRIALLVMIAALIAWSCDYRLPPDIERRIIAYLPQGSTLQLDQLTRLDWQRMAMTALPPVLEAAPDAVLVISVLLAGCVYGVMSRILTLLVLGVFPPVIRPLPPIRRLRVQTQAMRPVVVRSAVPPLPKRRKPVAQAVVTMPPRLEAPHPDDASVLLGRPA